MDMKKLYVYKNRCWMICYIESIKRVVQKEKHNNKTNCRRTGYDVAEFPQDHQSKLCASL